VTLEHCDEAQIAERERDTGSVPQRSGDLEALLEQRARLVVRSAKHRDVAGIVEQGQDTQLIPEPALDRQKLAPELTGLFGAAREGQDCGDRFERFSAHPRIGEVRREFTATACEFKCLLVVAPFRQDEACVAERSRVIAIFAHAVCQLNSVSQQLRRALGISLEER
jgi:hypothetical protein